jgi:hypothetical protein
MMFLSNISAALFLHADVLTYLTDVLYNSSFRGRDLFLLHGPWMRAPKKENEVSQ